MKEAINYLKGVWKAAHFSSDTRDYYTNSKSAAIASFKIPFALFLFKAMGLCYAAGMCSRENGVFWPFIFSFIFDVMITGPKVLIFFGLVWNLCQYCKQTDYFWSFVTANNWFYVVYALLTILHLIITGPTASISPMWWKVGFVYFGLVAFFLAGNVLRLPPQAAGLVAMAAYLAHFAIMIVTGKNGILFVF